MERGKADPNEASPVKQGFTGQRLHGASRQELTAETQGQVRNETLRTATGTVALPNHFNTMNRMDRGRRSEDRKRKLRREFIYMCN
jgi:hypothetical protein